MNLTLAEDFIGEIECHKPKSLALAAFCALLIEKGLDTITDSPLQPPVRGATRSLSSAVEEKEQTNQQPLKNTRAKADKDPFTSRTVSPDLVPDDLLDCQQLLPEFWSVKKGTRTRSVWNRVCNKLRAWTPEQRRLALEASINNGWGDVFEPRRSAAPVRQQDKPSLTEQARAMGLI